ncbi:MAG: hypothetical protein FWG69_02550 [Oscillospiraceae bacterium]|nr:hypothetical protein [Oscillospiraceae bacterium]
MRYNDTKPDPDPDSDRKNLFCSANTGTIIAADPLFIIDSVCFGHVIDIQGLAICRRK